MVSLARLGEGDHDAAAGAEGGAGEAAGAGLRAVGDELRGGESAVGPEAAGVNAGGVFGGAGFHPENEGGLVGEHHGLEAAHRASQVDGDRIGEGAGGVA